VGSVEACELAKDRETGRLKGFAFVVMDSAKAARAAKEKLDGHELHGKAIRVRPRRAVPASKADRPE
jgi:RNA recognition motif-containing protein